jgi:hypothetical protein
MEGTQAQGGRGIVGPVRIAKATARILVQPMCNVGRPDA